jgi:ubiquinone/menaquinone biosynthesis C-methylase UbiE
MLERVLEPEVMDTAGEADDYDGMDHSQVNRVFAADFLARWSGGGGPVLDVGCGTAQIPIELCRQHAAIEVVGIDLAEHMLAVGRRNVARAALTQRITLQKVDAKAMPFADAAFAAVVSNSIIHHIPEPRRALAEMVRVLRKDGVLFVRDLLRPVSGQAVSELVRLYAGDANAHQQKMFAESLGAALTLDEIQGLIAGLGLDPTAVKQTTDRHWTLAIGK